MSTFARYSGAWHKTKQLHGSLLSRPKSEKKIPVMNEPLCSIMHYFSKYLRLSKQPKV